MPLNTERFSNRVDNYIKYRPGYPKEVLQLFREEMKLENSSVVADIGVGTGISAKIFLENGNEVFGVEPNDAMRAGAEDFLENFSNYHSVKGTAENTTLRSASIDLVIAAQAFHWFEPEAARIEFRRILRPQSFVALMWNERQTASSEFLREYEKFLLEYGTDYKEVRHEKVTNALIENFFQQDYQEKVFSNSQTFDFAGLKGRLLSSSFIPLEDQPQFPQMIKDLERLFTQFQKNDTINILYETKVYYSQF